MVLSNTGRICVKKKAKKQNAFDVDQGRPPSESGRLRVWKNNPKTSATQH